MEMVWMDVPDEFQKYIGLKDLNKLPDDLKRYKCPICFAAGFTEPECPDCGNEHTELMCPLDHCDCVHNIIDGTAECPICEEFVCPECGAHSVEVVSRITGYLSAVSGWGNAKRQEFKDRHRVNTGDSEDA